jgi:hypothetical protein
VIRRKKRTTTKNRSDLKKAAKESDTIYLLLTMTAKAKRFASISPKKLCRSVLPNRFFA